MNTFSWLDTVRNHRSFASSAMAAGILVVATAWGVPAVFAATVLVSQSTTGTRGNEDSFPPAISADGSAIAFASRASNLVAGDVNGVGDVFVAYLSTKRSTLVSKSDAGIWGNDASDHPAISADGRYVAFESRASNLVDGDTNGVQDIFVHDLQTNSTMPVSMSSAGDWGNGDSSNPSISSDGRFIAFWSVAANLVVGDTNNASDVFVYDRQLNTTTVVSMNGAGDWGNGGSVNPSISSDGRCVAFASSASNLVDGDANGVQDIFLYDLQTNSTTLVSTSSAGKWGNGDSDSPSISSNGSVVAFRSYASNLVVGDTNNETDVFVRDLASQRTTLVSRSNTGALGNKPSFANSISADGRSVAFESSASNLVRGDTNAQQDVFVHDRTKKTTTLVSKSSWGVQADKGCGFPGISSDGRFVVFTSNASTLVRRFGDTGFEDVFVVGPLK